MIDRLLVKDFVSISDLKKNPVKVADHKMIAVLNYHKVCFYCISPSRAEELMRIEAQVKKNSENFVTISKDEFDSLNYFKEKYSKIEAKAHIENLRNLIKK